jgi:ketosteroid isomerase-like protein
MNTREIFERAMRPERLTGEVHTDHLADDVVLEWPFGPRRIDGVEAFAAIAGPARAALPFRVDEVLIDTVHETTDPEVIVVEYRLAGTMLATGDHRESPLIAVIRARDGRITHWREYQDTLAIAQAMTGS